MYVRRETQAPTTTTAKATYASAKSGTTSWLVARNMSSARLRPDRREAATEGMAYSTAAVLPSPPAATATGGAVGGTNVAAAIVVVDEVARERGGKGGSI